MHAMKHLGTLAVLSLSFSSVNADSTVLSATGDSRGLGFELARVNRSIEVNGISVDGNGGVGGLYAFYQQGAGLRAEGRLLTGNIDFESQGSEESASTKLVDIRTTLGMATENDTRLYGGLGFEETSGDSPFGRGDRTIRSLYAPIGIARAAQFSELWRVLVTVEGRVIVAGTVQVDNIPGIGDAELDRNGGVGLEVSAQFHKAGAGISVEPYLQLVVPSNTETENIAGTDVRMNDAEDAAAGIRVSMHF